MMRMAVWFLAAFLALPAMAQSESPGKLIERVSLDMLKTLQTEGAPKGKKDIMALVEQKVLPHFDFARMTALATGVGGARVGVGVGSSTVLHDPQRSATQTPQEPAPAAPSQTPASQLQWRDASGQVIPACRVDGRC